MLAIIRRYTLSEFNPLNPHPLIRDLESTYDMVRDLWDGTEAMRDAAEEYLPREPADTT